jgi:hypothetical protein
MKIAQHFPSFVKMEKKPTKKVCSVLRLLNCCLQSCFRVLVASIRMSPREESLLAATIEKLLCPNGI